MPYTVQIIKNIENDGTTDYTASTVDAQKPIAWYPSKEAGCRFGIESFDRRALSYGVGGGDIIDIINDAVKQFSSNGRVGATGTMPCNTLGDSVEVVWRLY